MSKEYTAYPLAWPAGWPRHDPAWRVESRFGRRNQGWTGRRPPSVAEGTSFIFAELKRMAVEDWSVVISTNIELRLDGLPYSNRRDPEDSGAAVYWTGFDDRKKHVLACDKYKSVGENLYAIGKTIEATRGIERWGSVTAEQAFSGYVALSERTGPSCWEILGIPPESTEEQILTAYRRKAMAAHPDQGGNTDAFQAVVAAKDMALQLRDA